MARLMEFKEQKAEKWRNREMADLSVDISAFDEGCPSADCCCSLVLSQVPTAVTQTRPAREGRSDP